MTRFEAIDLITCTYPADSSKICEAAVGKELLFKAISTCWKALPVEVLEEYARLCRLKLETVRDNYDEIKKSKTEVGGAPD